MSSIPSTPKEIERLRRDTRVKGEIICQACGGPAGIDRCGRLHDPKFVWQRIPEALMEIEDVHEWQGEKWGIRTNLPHPTVAGYSTECLSSWKGEEESFCLQLPNDWQIHVRWQDHPFYHHTVHREFDPNRNPLGHLCDVIGGNTKKIRDRHRLTWSAYDDPVNLSI